MSVYVACLPELEGYLQAISEAKARPAMREDSDGAEQAGDGVLAHCCPISEVVRLGRVLDGYDAFHQALSQNEKKEKIERE